MCRELKVPPGLSFSPTASFCQAVVCQGVLPYKPCRSVASRNPLGRASPRQAGGTRTAAELCWHHGPLCHVSALRPLLPREGLCCLGYHSNIPQTSATRNSEGLLTSSALPTAKRTIYSSRKATRSQDERGQKPAEM